MVEETEVSFENSKVRGVVAVGTYLIDAARRLGSRPKEACSPETSVHHCELSVTEGGELLSEPTDEERSLLGPGGIRRGRRMACFARIDSPGEIRLMKYKDDNKHSDETSDAKADDESDESEEYQKAFAELPLEKKIADLVRLEAITLADTFSFVLNSPFKVFDKALDVMAEFGFQKEQQSKEAARPKEHAASSEKKSGRKRRSKARKKDDSGDQTTS